MLHLSDARFITFTKCVVQTACMCKHSLIQNRRLSRQTLPEATERVSTCIRLFSHVNLPVMPHQDHQHVCVSTH